MKKNKMMRLASAMMVLTLMSTSVISGTFAKYVTSDSAQDTARVAKFGVTVTAAGSLFNDSYKNVPTTYNATEEGLDITVQADSAGTNVVAPGTESKPEGLTFAITGTPEVDVNLKIVVTDLADGPLGDDDNVYLKADEYFDSTTGNAEDKYNLAADYTPVVYTLWQDKGSGFSKVTGAEDVNLSTLATVLAKDVNVDANKNLSEEYGTYKITWKWEFEDDNKADTILGDIAAGTVTTNAAGTTLVENTNYKLTTGLKVTVTVTQID